MQMTFFRSAFCGIKHHGKVEEKEMFAVSRFCICVPSGLSTLLRSQQNVPFRLDRRSFFAVRRRFAELVSNKYASLFSHCIFGCNGLTNPIFVCYWIVWWEYFLVLLTFWNFMVNALRIAFGNLCKWLSNFFYFSFVRETVEKENDL